MPGHSFFAIQFSSISFQAKHRDAWNDLSRNHRIKVASSLMNILEEHAFLLADVLQQPETIIESTKLAGMLLISYYIFLKKVYELLFRHTFMYQ